jgi:hypothetical protein
MIARTHQRRTGVPAWIYVPVQAGRSGFAMCILQFSIRVAEERQFQAVAQQLSKRPVPGSFP